MQGGGGGGFGDIFNIFENFMYLKSKHVFLIGVVEVADNKRNKLGQVPS